MDLTLGLAFLAGLASFLSPCVFSLVPAYISYLSGRSLAVLKSSESTAIQVGDLHTWYRLCIRVQPGFYFTGCHCLSAWGSII